MTKVEKVVLLTELFDIYQFLLTDKQKLIFSYYYFDDWTFTEIEKELKITRPAISDSLKKIENKLFFLEESLRVNSMKKILQNIIDDTYKNKSELNKKILEEFKK